MYKVPQNDERQQRAGDNGNGFRFHFGTFYLPAKLSVTRRKVFAKAGMCFANLAIYESGEWSKSNRRLAVTRLKAELYNLSQTSYYENSTVNLERPGYPGAFANSYGMEFIIIFILILLNGVFSMSEIALVSSRKQRLESAVRRGSKGAKTALELSNAPGRFLSTVQIGITLIGILTGIYSGESITLMFQAWVEQFELLRPYAHTVAITTVLIIITLVSLIVGELVPKRIGLANPEGISMRMAGPMKIISIIASPFVWLLTRSTDLIIRIFRIRPSGENKVTEEEIKAIIEEGKHAGEVQEIEQEIVERAFSLGDRKVGALMTYRSDVVTISITAGPREIRDIVSKEMHSVYPVVDTDGEVAGTIHIKDLFLHLDDPDFTIKKFIQTPHYFSESVPAYKALETFKTTGKHYAVVIDDYGTMQGFFAINDLLTALVGSVDEFDPDYAIQERPDGSWLIDGNYPLYDVLLYFNVDAEETTDVHTLGGLVMDELRRIPRQGDKIRWKNFEIEVVDMDGTRVDKLLLSKKE
jgi:putative hemolysin